MPESPSLPTVDVVFWEPRFADFLLEMAWPTYGKEVHTFRSKFRNLGEVTGKLCGAGYRLKAVESLRYGFLGLRTTPRYIFEKQITWTRDGTATSYVGHRNNPSIAECFKADLMPSVHQDD